MYKTRGKPEDPWNKAASKQEKSLAEAIHVNQLHKNGVVESLNPTPSSIIARQREFSRRRNNYEQFKEIYRMKKFNNNAKEKSKDVSNVTTSSMKSNLSSIVKRYVKGGLNKNNNINEKDTYKYGTLLRAPLGAVKTINVAVPSRYTEDAIFSPSKTDEVEPLNLVQKLRNLENFSDNPNEFINEGFKWQCDLVTELENAKAEVDIGNVQLQQINNILKATKSLGFSATGEKKQKALDKKNLYNVQQKASQKEIPKNNRLLLTLNNVNQRIQKMQNKFFNEERPKYKCIKSPLYNLKLKKNVDILYENQNCMSSLNTVTKIKSENASIQLESAPSKEFENKSSRIYKTISCCGSPRAQQVNSKQTAVMFNNNYNEIPQYEETAKFNITKNIHNTNDILQPKTIRFNIPEPDIFINNVEDNKAEFENIDFVQDYLEDESENESVNESVTSSLKPQLQESIFKSDYLMKEFDLDIKGINYDMNKLSLSSKKKQTKNKFCINNKLLERIEKRNFNHDYITDITDKDLYTSNLDYALKNTLFCVDDK